MCGRNGNGDRAMSLVRGVQHYFLRVYAEECRKENRSGAWGPFGEAMFQTVLLASLPIAGLSAATVVLFFSSLEQILTSYGGPIAVGFALASLAAVYLSVRHIVGDPKALPALISAYGTRRDRAVQNIQFWCVLGGSLALPWLAAAARKLSD